MNPDPIRDLLVRSLQSVHLSRKDRQALAEALEDGDDRARRAVRQRAFELARETGGSIEISPLLEWVEAVVEATFRAERTPVADASEAHFSPGDACYRRIAGLFDRAERSVEVCVFTITDDRISDAILAAHARDVAIRIVADNSKALDLGSDIERFERAGIPVRVDRTEYHMHHKFALFDARFLLTGSYNWTRGAADSNEENIIVTPDAHLVRSFATAFEGLWNRLGPG
jgi:mitochondrial cardiolipin hydrolase